MKIFSLALLIINLLFLIAVIGYSLNYNNLRNIIMIWGIFPPGKYFISWELVIITCLLIDLYGTSEAKLARINNFLRAFVGIFSFIIFLFIMVALGVGSEFLNNPRFTSLNPEAEGGIATIYYTISIAGLLNTAGVFSYFLVKASISPTIESKDGSK